MSSNPNDRTALSTFRNIGSMAGNLLVMIMIPKMIFNAQGAVTSEGFVISAIVLAIISTISFLLNFRLTRERIIYKTHNDRNMKKVLKGLLKNRAFIGVALASFTMMSGMLIVSSLNVYLFKDYFKSPALTALGGMCSMLASFIVIPFAGVIVRKIGKKETAVLGAIIATVFYTIMLFIPNLTAYIFIILSFLAGLGSGLINTIIWALVSDAIDYQEYITGERNEGTVYSSYSLARKLAQAISGGIGGFALSILGYQSGIKEQSVAVAEGIKNIAIGGAITGFSLTTIILIFVYNLSKKKVIELNIKLEERRENLYEKSC